MSTSQYELAEALIRMFGHDAIRQARENAASNARDGDTASARMWKSVAEIVSEKLARGAAARPAPE